MAEPAAANDLQAKYRQFLDLLPLTLALAGLPPSEGRLFGEEQIEAQGDHGQGRVSRRPHGREGMPGWIVRPLPVGSIAGGAFRRSTLFAGRGESDKTIARRAG